MAHPVSPSSPRQPSSSRRSRSQSQSKDPASSPSHPYGLPFHSNSGCVAAAVASAGHTHPSPFEPFTFSPSSQSSQSHSLSPTISSSSPKSDFRPSLDQPSSSPSPSTSSFSPPSLEMPGPMSSPPRRMAPPEDAFYYHQSNSATNSPTRGTGRKAGVGARFNRPGTAAGHEMHEPSAAVQPRQLFRPGHQRSQSSSDYDHYSAQPSSRPVFDHSDQGSSGAKSKTQPLQKLQLPNGVIGTESHSKEGRDYGPRSAPENDTRFRSSNTFSALSSPPSSSFHHPPSILTIRRDREKEKRGKQFAAERAGISGDFGEPSSFGNAFSVTAGCEPSSVSSSSTLTGRAQAPTENDTASLASSEGFYDPHYKRHPSTPIGGRDVPSRFPARPVLMGEEAGTSGDGGGGGGGTAIAPLSIKKPFRVLIDGEQLDNSAGISSSSPASKKSSPMQTPSLPSRHSPGSLLPSPYASGSPTTGGSYFSHSKAGTDGRPTFLRSNSSISARTASPTSSQYVSSSAYNSGNSLPDSSSPSKDAFPSNSSFGSHSPKDPYPTNWHSTPSSHATQPPGQYGRQGTNSITRERSSSLVAASLTSPVSPSLASPFGPRPSMAQAETSPYMFDLRDEDAGYNKSPSQSIDLLGDAVVPRQRMVSTSAVGNPTFLANGQKFHLESFRSNSLDSQQSAPEVSHVPPAQTEEKRAATPSTIGGLLDSYDRSQSELNLSTWSRDTHSLEGHGSPMTDVASLRPSTPGSLRKTEYAPSLDESLDGERYLRESEDIPKVTQSPNLPPGPLVGTPGSTATVFTTMPALAPTSGRSEFDIKPRVRRSSSHSPSRPSTSTSRPSISITERPQFSSLPTRHFSGSAKRPSIADDERVRTSTENSSPSSPFSSPSSPFSTTAATNSHLRRLLSGSARSSTMSNGGTPVFAAAHVPPRVQSVTSSPNSLTSPGATLPILGPTDIAIKVSKGGPKRPRTAPESQPFDSKEPPKFSRKYSIDQDPDFFPEGYSLRAQENPLSSEETGKGLARRASGRILKAIGVKASLSHIGPLEGAPGGDDLAPSLKNHNSALAKSSTEERNAVMAKGWSPPFQDLKDAIAQEPPDHFKSTSSPGLDKLDSPPIKSNPEINLDSEIKLKNSTEFSNLAPSSQAVLPGPSLPQPKKKSSLYFRKRSNTGVQPQSSEPALPVSVPVVAEPVPPTTPKKSHKGSSTGLSRLANALSRKRSSPALASKPSTPPAFFPPSSSPPSSQSGSFLQPTLPAAPSKGFFGLFGGGKLDLSFRDDGVPLPLLEAFGERGSERDIRSEPTQPAGPSLSFLSVGPGKSWQSLDMAASPLDNATSEADATVVPLDRISTPSLPKRSTSTHPRLRLDSTHNAAMSSISDRLDDPEPPPVPAIPTSIQFPQRQGGASLSVDDPRPSTDSLSPGRLTKPPRPRRTSSSRKLSISISNPALPQTSLVGSFEPRPSTESSMSRQSGRSNSRGALPFTRSPSSRPRTTSSASSGPAKSKSSSELKSGDQDSLSTSVPSVASGIRPLTSKTGHLVAVNPDEPEEELGANTYPSPKESKKLAMLDADFDALLSSEMTTKLSLGS